ncbi:hypothetical protein EKO04_009771 [Ascochyta lentis]|uniref:Uncharacterized protein n=1 Tax=Ascochyta lentis TaxID=205686 RepID=A0A8H7MDV0_9PLEO|nr:hypothetical protein EKO04_009771 [Ascochyta lentis]
MPSNSDNPAPLHPSNTPEALKHLAPFEPWAPRSFPLPEGYLQLNGEPATYLPPHSTVRDLPLARIGGRAAMTAEPLACPRPRRGSSADGLRLGGARERLWEEAQERRPLLDEMRPVWSREAEQAFLGLRDGSSSPLRRVSDAGVGVGSPWSSLMDGLSESDFDPTTLLFDPPPPPPPRPSLLSQLLGFLRHLFGRLFPSLRRTPTPPSPAAAPDLHFFEAGEREFDSDDDFIVEYGDEEYSAEQYDNPWSDEE